MGVAARKRSVRTAQSVLALLRGTFRCGMYRMVEWFVPIPRSGGMGAGRVLVVRVDLIGDYVLFRNFLEVLRTQGPYRNHSITLIGNEAWRDLAEWLDGKWIDEFIWIDRRRFARNLLYRWRKLREVAAKEYDVVLHATFSREFLCGDWICRIARAPEKIASTGNLSNLALWQKRICDQWFTRLVDAARGTQFEFDRNRDFFEAVLGSRLQAKAPTIGLSCAPEQHAVEAIPKGAFAFAVGASIESRRWPAESFGRLAQRIGEQYGARVVLVGGAADGAPARQLRACGPADIVDLTGKTSLPELVRVISRCRCFVGNDSGSAHIAAALGIPTVAISSGYHYWRFFPYPVGTSEKCVTVAHPQIVQNQSELEQEAKMGEISRGLDIREISVEQVEQAIAYVLSVKLAPSPEIPDLAQNYCRSAGG